MPLKTFPITSFHGSIFWVLKNRHNIDDVKVLVDPIFGVQKNLTHIFELKRREGVRTRSPTWVTLTSGMEHILPVNFATCCRLDSKYPKNALIEG